MIQAMKRLIASWSSRRKKQTRSIPRKRRRKRKRKKKRREPKVAAVAAGVASTKLIQRRTMGLKLDARSVPMQNTTGLSVF